MLHIRHVIKDVPYIKHIGDVSQKIRVIQYSIQYSYENLTIRGQTYTVRIVPAGISLLYCQKWIFPRACQTIKE